MNSRTFGYFLTELTDFCNDEQFSLFLSCINLVNIRISCKLIFTSKGDLGESVSRNHNGKCAFVIVCN